MIAVSDAEFDRAAQAALSEIPAELRGYLENVMIEVRPRPDAKLMADFDVPGDILGLYVGCPLENQSSAGPVHALPDRIFIFRDNLCAMCVSIDELIEEIRVTVLHEIGHHFGLDEDRLEELGYD